MLKQDESLSELLLTLVIQASNLFIKIYLVVLYWQWFIVPLMEDPSKLNMPIAYGMLSIFGLFTFNTNKIKSAMVAESVFDSKPLKSYSALTLSSITTFVLFFTWLITYIVSKYV